MEVNGAINSKKPNIGAIYSRKDSYLTKVENDVATLNALYGADAVTVTDLWDFYELQDKIEAASVSLLKAQLKLDKYYDKQNALLELMLQDFYMVDFSE